jgi:hypothetical protein
MQDEVAYDWRCDEPRESENVRNGVDILMWSKLSQNLEEGFIRLWEFRSEEWRSIQHTARDQGNIQNIW